ncbi:cytochrome P450 716B2 [Cryptomeria japonica]|uniref:cytochrome P450 716B2 n=1 Tax=Cryptomeria japonica TaxID=3369 RepID=UPI0027DA94B0|nr:cytochrome P450 716B2 [Cryptomeria japonica]
MLLSVAVASVLFVLVAKVFYNGGGKKLPPGSLGFPLIGETIGFLNALKKNECDKWVADKVAKHGPIFKTSLMGIPTAVLTGPEGNRFVFQNDYHTIVNSQPRTFMKIFGSKNITELFGEEHKRIRNAIMTFMRPEALQKCVARMESVVLEQFEENWEGRESLLAYPLVKQLTFYIAFDNFFGLKDSKEKEILNQESIALIKAIWSLPLNFPGTTLNKGLKTRARVLKRLNSMVNLRRREIAEGKTAPDQDLMSCLITMKDDDNKSLTDEEIIDNMLVLMIGGHDTTASLLAQLVRMLYLNPHVYKSVLEEQTAIRAAKQPNEPLVWEDVRKMEYTHKVVNETLRMVPPTVGGFRMTVADVQYKGYTIPKGWQIFWESTTTHFNGEYFKDPRTFDPTHFDNKPPPYTFIAFGAGARLCVGYEFARMQSKIFLHHLVCKYKWSMINPHEKIASEPLPVPCEGLPINIQVRKN